MATEDTAPKAPQKGPEEKAPLNHFSCETCGNEFDAEGEIGVCNGLNVRADNNGNPIYDDDNRLQVIDLRTGERATDPRYGNVVTGVGHAPTIMTRTKVKGGK